RQLDSSTARQLVSSSIVVRRSQTSPTAIRLPIDGPGPGMDAMILLAHGARSDEWAHPFREIQELLQAARPGLQVDLAFLEFMEPGFATACDRLATAGASRIVVCPLFLGVGGHVARDIPLLIEAARSRWPGVRIEPTATL